MENQEIFNLISALGGINGTNEDANEDKIKKTDNENPEQIPFDKNTSGNNNFAEILSNLSKAPDAIKSILNGLFSRQNNNLKREELIETSDLSTEKNKMDSKKKSLTNENNNSSFTEKGKIVHPSVNPLISAINTHEEFVKRVLKKQNQTIKT